VSADAKAAAAPAVDGFETVRLALVELLGAERRMRARDQRCRPGELTQAQVRALFAIDIVGQATAGELARAGELSPASVSAMLDHLERDGIVQRHRAEHDRRVVVVTLTESGRALVAAKRERWRASGRAALEGVPEADLRAAADGMRRLAGLFDGISAADDQADEGRSA
jgi:DNA-binding MarR family transcriptional regulator